MMDYSLLLDLFMLAMILIIGIRVAIVFFRRRTKYNLTVLIIATIILANIVLDLLLPWKVFAILKKPLTFIVDRFGFGIAVQIILLAIVIIPLCAFLFYPEINGFFSRRRTKK